jgi:Recombination endonuclease VII.
MEWFNERLEQIGHRCEDCGLPAPIDYWRYSGNLYPLVLDHDHRYNKRNPLSWRKILCRSCNAKHVYRRVSYNSELMLNGH